LTLHAIAEAQKQEELRLLLMPEHAFDRNYAEKLGG
jgi:RecA/RadA recombinase